jgi:hypothetical protein
MYAKSRRIIAGVALSAIALAVTGCGAEYHQRTDTLATYTGDAVRRNIAIHTINPRPRRAYDNHIHTSGRRLESAMATYNAGGGETGGGGDVEAGAELQEPGAPEGPQ